MLDVAIIGLGQWGRHLVDCVQKQSNKLRFTVANTLDPEGAVEFARRNELRLIVDLDTVLANDDIAGVVLATPHSQHRDQIVRAAARKKHVFVEKPLALTRQDAEEAARACAAAGVGLFVGYNWRFQPAVQKLHSIVQSGVLGTVVHVEGNYSGPSAYKRTRGSWRTLRSENPAGGMTGRGIHVINVMNLLCGPVVSVFAYNDRHAAPDDLEDTTSALLRFKTGVTGYVGASQVTAEFWRVHVFGSNGWAEMRMENDLTVCSIDCIPETIQFAPSAPERAELEAFADAVAANRFSHQAIRDAINGVAILEAIDQSGRTEQPVVLDADGGSDFVGSPSQSSAVSTQ
jgi:predicted dehydrogenase